MDRQLDRQVGWDKEVKVISFEIQKFWSSIPNIIIRNMAICVISNFRFQMSLNRLIPVPCQQ